MLISSPKVNGGSSDVSSSQHSVSVPSLIATSRLPVARPASLRMPRPGSLRRPGSFRRSQQPTLDSVRIRNRSMSHGRSAVSIPDAEAIRITLKMQVSLDHSASDILSPSSPEQVTMRSARRLFEATCRLEQERRQLSSYQKPSSSFSTGSQSHSVSFGTPTTKPASIRPRPRSIKAQSSFSSATDGDDDESTCTICCLPSVHCCCISFAGRKLNLPFRMWATKLSPFDAARAAPSIFVPPDVLLPSSFIDRVIEGANRCLGRALPWVTFFFMMLLIVLLFLQYVGAKGDLPVEYTIWGSIFSYVSIFLFALVAISRFNRFLLRSLLRTFQTYFLMLNAFTWLVISFSSLQSQIDVVYDNWHHMSPWMIALDYGLSYVVTVMCFLVLACIDALPYLNPRLKAFFLFLFCLNVFRVYYANALDHDRSEKDIIQHVQSSFWSNYFPQQDSQVVRLQLLVNMAAFLFVRMLKVMAGKLCALENLLTLHITDPRSFETLSGFPTSIRAQRVSTTPLAMSKSSSNNHQNNNDSSSATSSVSFSFSSSSSSSSSSLTSSLLSSSSSASYSSINASSPSSSVISSMVVSQAQTNVRPSPPPSSNPLTSAALSSLQSQFDAVAESKASAQTSASSPPAEEKKSLRERMNELRVMEHSDNEDEGEGEGGDDGESEEEDEDGSDDDGNAEKDDDDDSRAVSPPPDDALSIVSSPPESIVSTRDVSYDESAISSHFQQSLTSSSSQASDLSSYHSRLQSIADMSSSSLAHPPSPTVQRPLTLRHPPHYPSVSVNQPSSVSSFSASSQSLSGYSSSISTFPSSFASSINGAPLLSYNSAPSLLVDNVPPSSALSNASSTSSLSFSESSRLLAHTASVDVGDASPGEYFRLRPLFLYSSSYRYRPLFSWSWLEQKFLQMSWPTVVFFSVVFTAFVGFTFVDAPRNVTELIIIVVVTFIVCLPFLVMLDRRLLKNLLRQVEFWFILFQTVAFTFANTWQEYVQYQVKCADYALKAPNCELFIPDPRVLIAHHVVRFGFFAIATIVLATLDSVPFKSPRYKLVFVLLFLVNALRIYVWITFFDPLETNWFGNIRLPFANGFFDTQTVRSQSLLSLLTFVIKYALALVIYPDTLVVYRAPISAPIFGDDD